MMVQNRYTFKFRRMYLLLFFIILTVYGAKSYGQDEPATVKVLSYNIHYGVGMDSKKDLARIADVINNAKPDIVGLQEVSDSMMVAILSKLTDMNGIFGASTEKEAPNLYRLLDIPLPGSQLFYGDAILSKHPVKYVGNLSIPSASSSRYEAMCVDIDLSQIYSEGTFVRFINTHFDYLQTIGSKAARMASADVIETAFFSEDDKLPSILTGDLNVIPDSDPVKRLQKYGWVYENLNMDLYTIPTVNPVKQIDYVLVRPKHRWRILDIEVINEPHASDHLPILMTLELVSGKL